MEMKKRKLKAGKEKFIPWAKPVFRKNEIKYVTEALNSTWISGGPNVNKLENNFCELFEKKHSLAVSNGTSAIHLAYLGLCLRPGDEVIVPGFAFMAAANIALHMNLKPVFAEIDTDTWCLSVKSLEKYITKKTKAIVAVHTYGNVCSMNEIMQIASNYSIPVIEDCAESIFSKYENKYCGTFGKISTFSFHATKTITTGEGGLLITDEDEMYNKMVLYRSHGMNRSKQFYMHDLPGHNFRLTNLQAAIGVAQLEKKHDILKDRKRVYEKYKKYLGKTEGISLQKIEKEVEPVIWAVALKLDEVIFKQGRDSAIGQLEQAGIETRPGFYSSPQLKIYEPHSLPVAQEVSKSVISLPSFPSLPNEDIEFICEQLLKLRNV